MQRVIDLNITRNRIKTVEECDATTAPKQHMPLQHPQ